MEITIGATVARRSKGASTGRTGQVIEIDGDYIRVHWTKKANGGQMSARNWINRGELMVVATLTKAQQSIADKMTYIINRVGEGPLSSLDEGELIGRLEAAKDHKSIWGVAIRQHFDKPAEDRDDWHLINGMASQCMDDLFGMVCIIGQEAVILLLRTVNP